MRRFQFSLRGLLLFMALLSILLTYWQCDWTGRGWEVVTCVEFSPDGTHAILGGYSGRHENEDFHNFNVDVRRALAVVDLNSDSEPEFIEDAGFHESFSHIGDIGRFAAFGPDGATVVFASSDCRLILWDIVKRRVLRRGGQYGDRKNIAFSRDGDSVATSMLDGGQLCAIGSDRMYRIPRDPYWSDPESIRFSPDGAALAIGYFGSLALYQVDALKKQPSPVPFVAAKECLARGMAFSPDGKRLAIAGPPIELFDLSSGVRHTLATMTASSVWEVAFTPNGRTLATAGPDGVVLIDIDSDRRLAQLPLSGVMRSVAVSGDGQRLLAGDHNGQALLWDLPAGKLLRRFNVVRYPKGISPIIPTVALALWLTVWAVSRKQRRAATKPLVEPRKSERPRERE